MNVSFIHEYDLLLPQWNEQWYSMIRLTWPIFLLSLLVSATLLVFFPLFTIIYQAFERQKANYLLQTSLRLLESYWKWFARTSVQRWCNIVTLPGFSYVLPAPADILALQLYYEIWKLICRLRSLLFLEIIHSVAEVMDRSLLVVTVRFCHVILKKGLALLEPKEFRMPIIQRHLQLLAWLLQACCFLTHFHPLATFP